MQILEIFYIKVCMFYQSYLVTEQDAVSDDFLKIKQMGISLTKNEDF